MQPSKLSLLGMVLAIVSLTLSFLPTPVGAVARCIPGASCLYQGKEGSCGGGGSYGICMCYFPGGASGSDDCQVVQKH